METQYKDPVYVDWKCESEDMIYALRERYQKELPCILQCNFDELAENYAVEEPEDFFGCAGAGTDEFRVFFI